MKKLVDICLREGAKNITIEEYNQWVDKYEKYHDKYITMFSNLNENDEMPKSNKEYIVGTWKGYYNFNDNDPTDICFACEGNNGSGHFEVLRIMEKRNWCTGLDNKVSKMYQSILKISEKKLA